MFWKNLAPRAGDRPDGELAELIKRDFGSFETFQKQMTEVAATVMGSGWAALMWEPVGQRLITCQIYDHQSNISQGNLPLMVIDAWEHAYYLQYKNAKTEFFNAVWHLWNWQDIAARLQAAKQVDLRVPEPAAR
jgi:Fe-Mn family superoxide dismutase